MPVSPRHVFVLAYALSGAAALIYQVSWVRLLALHMGHGLASVSTVLAAFMGGLALGAALAGRVAPRLPPVRALRLYAALEWTVAASALVIPLAIGQFHPLLAATYNDGAGGITFGVVRALSSLIILILPCCALGATLPLACRWFVRHGDDTGAQAGTLYAVNVVGATVGVLLAGFYLLPTVGLRSTTTVAALLSATAGLIGWVIARQRGVGSPLMSPHPHVRVAGPPSHRRQRADRARVVASSEVTERSRPHLAAASVAVSGFVGLVCEVAWTRALALVIGPTTYAFSVMLASFIAGIAVGAIVGSALARRARHPRAWLALALLGVAAGNLAASWYIAEIPLKLAGAVAGSEVPFSAMLYLTSTIVAMLLLPLAIWLGMVFPLALDLASRRTETVAADVALVYSANTAGAIGGALLCGFVLVPVLGLASTLAGASLIAAAWGLVLVLSAPHRRDRPAGVVIAAAVLAVAIAAPPRWNPELLTAGAYTYARRVNHPDLETALTAGELLYLGEGAAGTVTVRKLAATTSLAIDGKVDASNGADMLTQKLLAHLPLLLHPEPSDVLVIGLGSGVTLGSALTHPIGRADVVEISPLVVEASRYFEGDNHHALDDPRTRLVVGDGRTHLRLSSRQYDVIVSEPSNPWMAGVASLFTQEFFRSARQRLAPGGILCQWAHTYDITDDDLTSIVATFASVFPDGTMWLVGDADLLLLGARHPLEGQVDQIARSWQRTGIAADLAEVGALDPAHLLALYLGGPEALKQFASEVEHRDVPIQTDDHTRLEFSAPRGLYGPDDDGGLERLRAIGRNTALPEVVKDARKQADATTWRTLGQMLTGANAGGAAYEAFAWAVALDPGDTDSIDGLVQAAAETGRLPEAESLLHDLVSAHPGSLAARLGLSRLLASTGRHEEALAVATAARALSPAHPAVREHLASIYSDIGDVTRLADIVDDMLLAEPFRDATLYYAASLSLLQNRLAQAIDYGTALTAGNPTHARAQNLLGIAYAQAARPQLAREAFMTSIDAAPEDPTTYANVGLLELREGDLEAANRWFAVALSLDPGSPGALDGLATVFERRGEVARARRLRHDSAPE